MSSLCYIVLCLLALVKSASSIDYGAALTKSLLYFEAQRSGKLPPTQRVQWRGDSALADGKDAGVTISFLFIENNKITIIENNKISQCIINNFYFFFCPQVDLVGGYYDAGDNVKFGFPMAFTVTMLAWSVVEFEPQLRARGELSNARRAVKWGTDYLIKAHPLPNVLYGQVGDGGSDHSCWQRPEDMTTPRTVYRIDEQHPGSDLAAESAAALAAASIVFWKSRPDYSSRLLNHSTQAKISLSFQILNN